MATAGWAGEVDPRSVGEQDGVTYWLGTAPDGARVLGVAGDATGFVGGALADGQWVGPCSAAKVAALPWAALDTTYADLAARYCRAPVVLAGLVLAFDEITLLRALAKYGRALAHTAALAAAIGAQLRGAPYDLEMSVDETDTPT